MAVSTARPGGTSARLSADREVNFCAKHVLKHATTLHIYIYIHIRIARKTTGRKQEEKKKRNSRRTYYGRRTSEEWDTKLKERRKKRKSKREPLVRKKEAEGENERGKRYVCELAGV